MTTSTLQVKTIDTREPMAILENYWSAVRLTLAVTLKRPNFLKKEIQISYDKRIDDQLLYS